MEPSVEVDDKVVLKNLKEFSEKDLIEAYIKGLNKACGVVEASAKVKCPVDSGQLRNSITSAVDTGNLEGAVGTNVEYAPYVEIGTGIYSSLGNGRKDAWAYVDAEGKGHYTHGSKPQPFLKPALDENKARILDCFKGLI